MKTIMLDAGHGGSDVGAVNGARKESVDVLKLAKSVKEYLEKRSGGKIKVYMTRTVDTYVGLLDRSEMANNKKVDCFVSLHRDSASPSANGCTVRVQNGCINGNAGKLAKAITKRTNVFFKGNRADDDNVIEQNLSVTRNTIMPSCLVEAGFITSSKDNDIFDKQYQKLVEAIGDGIMEYLGIKKVVQNTTTVKGVFRVVVGSYADRKNAEAMQKKLKDKGFDSFLIFEPKK